MLHYELKGAGDRTIVCLHGFLENLSMWDAITFHSYDQLILIDLPGHGKSDLSAIDSMSDMARAVKSVLDKEGIAAYDVIGHSMGGYVALELDDLDENCHQVILLNSNVWGDSDQKKEDRNRVAQLVQTKKERFISEAIPNLFLRPRNHDIEVKALVKEATEMSANAIARASIAMSNRKDYSEQTYSNSLNPIVIQGKYDPIADASRMEQILSNQLDRYHVVDSGHMAHLEATEEVISILEKL